MDNDIAVVLAITFYLIAGSIFLVIFDLITKRVRSRLKDASYETQRKLVESGSFVGLKASFVVLLFAMWIFWPVVLWGVMTSKKGDGGINEKQGE